MCAQFRKQAGEGFCDEEIGMLVDRGVDDGDDAAELVYGAPFASPPEAPGVVSGQDALFARLQARIERLEAEHMSVNERDEKHLCGLLQSFGFTEEQANGILLAIRSQPLSEWLPSLDDMRRPHDRGGGDMLRPQDRRVRVRGLSSRRGPARVVDGDDDDAGGAGIAYGAPFGYFQSRPERMFAGPMRVLPGKLEQLMGELGPYLVAALPHVIKAVADRLDERSRPPLSWWQRKAHQLLGL
jgi:hypothetical protein